MVEVHPDEKGIVRTVSIIYKKKNKKEKPEELKKNSMVKERIGVQRLILIQPASTKKVDKNVDSAEDKETMEENPKPV